MRKALVVAMVLTALVLVFGAVGALVASDSQAELSPLPTQSVLPADGSYSFCPVGDPGCCKGRDCS